MADRQTPYTISVFPSEGDGDHGDAAPTRIQQRLVDFIMDFHLDNVFIYRDQIRENVLIKQYYCDVDIAHLISVDEELAHKLTQDPAEIIPLFEAALKSCTQRIVYPSQRNIKLPEHQLLLHSSAAKLSIRDLTAAQVSHLVRIPGIIIGASTLSSKSTTLAIRCRNCQHEEVIPVSGGFSGVSLPRICSRQRGENDDRCPLDPYYVLHERCQFIDQQVLKMQEAPDEVPVGELPRHIMISADRYLANRVVPGTRCTVMGIHSIYQQKGSKRSQNAAVAIRNPYIRAVGIHADVDHTAKGNLTFTEEEEQEFLEMSRRRDIYEVFANCIAPSIYGNKDIKKAIACLLVGGSKKILPDGMKLRGDINVLLLGDPGTAKSQLLKFVEKAAPIAVYTSGKGSSAAGLTASVQRDHNTREFYLEGGAMVLADGGVVCIDEFDKMRDEDRVAIHEAMEQQTISIAKAGITTILNSRTSVLAAANPIFGRYDDMKTPGENIDFQTTILSRFDMIFIVRDEHDRGRDERIAKHVMGLAMGGRGTEEVVESEIDIKKMKRYISYCRQKCAPRLSPEAAEKLSSHFVSIRRQVHASEMNANQRSSIPITVRQLEAIIRITESLAKLSLSPVADESHVDEAIRLFLASTMDAVTQGEGQASKELMDEVNKVEEELRRRMPIGWQVNLSTLKREMCDGKGYSEQALGRALHVMAARETIQILQCKFRPYSSLAAAPLSRTETVISSNQPASNSEAMTEAKMLKTKKQSAVDAGYGVGRPMEDTEPFPDFNDLSRTLAYDLFPYEMTAIETTRQKFTSNRSGLDNVAHPRAAHALDHDTFDRTDAWLDPVHETKPFEQVLFFDADSSIDEEGLESFAFFNGETLAHEELVDASIILRLPNNDFLYDRAAIETFLEREVKRVLYWGPEVKAQPLAASSTDFFYSLPSYTSTEIDEEENPFSDECGVVVGYETLSTALNGTECDEEDDDDDAESEASFGCVTAAAHDEAVAVEKARQLIKHLDLPFRQTFDWVPLKYVNKKKHPPPAILLPGSDEKRTAPITRPLKSFQRLAPRKDKTVALRAMRANIRNAVIVWPTHSMYWAPLQSLPPPRMQARPPRPNASMFQPVHPEVKAQRETAKPLYLTVIQSKPDVLPARHFPFELTPDSLGSLDLLRLPSATISVHSVHSYQAEPVPAPLHIDAKGIWPRPGLYTIQPVDLNIRAQWKHTKPQSYHQRHAAEQQFSGVEMNEAGELTLVNVLEEHKPRTPLVFKPFKFLGKLLRVATRIRDEVV
ncbi:minichromosome maintenance protein 5 [Didymosphaeria variabile]|uniref:DNA helicase n=1 Tax=Didymosphaeria variabile TaxID=1932322 RepID=A0A9W8XDA9_9PLEO|nr:minichromosome maintenance protein 5 [Didymosphaeria variabile]KAJ4346712.1 minichromosome maintenance protein 5 [Didymosphaeria variabile]